jgi:two-component sensor histidine kinase
MRQRTLSLRRRLSILGLLIVCPLLIAGTVVSALYVLGEQKSLRNEATATVRDAATTIDHELRGHLLALQIISTSINVGDDRFERVYRQAKQLSDTIDGSVVSLRRDNGDLEFDTRLPLGTTPEKAMSEELRSAEGKGLRNRAFAISDVFVEARTGKAYVAIVQPVIAGGTTYLLDLAIPAEIIATIMRSQLRHPEWLIGVTGNDHRMIARNWESERYVGQRASDAFIQNTPGNEGVFEASTIDGVGVFTAYTRSKLTGWRVATGIPIRIFEAPLYHSLFALVGIGFIGLFCSLGFSYAYAGIILRPAKELRFLANASRRDAQLPRTTGIREFDDVVGVLGKAFSDLDDRDRHQQTLVNELNHRAKNTLTAIQAIARQTYRQSKSWEDFRNNFEYRLMAMAQSFDLLTKNDWVSGELREVITECSKPFCETDKIQLTGPSVLLSPRAIVGVGMIIHELATNATKYGALSTATGWVEVNWEVQKVGRTQKIHLQWKEREGPGVVQSAHKGFGSSLIASTIENDLHGEAETKLDADGLHFSASFPIDNPRTA